MEYWILGILALAIVAAVVAAAISKPAAKETAERRRRYALDAEGAERIPLAPERTAEAPPAVPAENGMPIFAPLAEEPVRSNRLIDLAREEPEIPSGNGPVIGGTLVQTPDGEMILTTPPFALRPQLFSRRVGRYFNGLSRRLPAWVVACPRMRLEALVTPTPPDGRDPDDWAQWRRRVRMRAVDIVICDRRTWKPLVAIMLEPRPGGRFQRRGGTGGTSTALVLGGGQDRMIDEVLGHVGLPLIRGSGELAADWPLIAPYVDEAILRTRTEEEVLDATDAANERPDPEAAVNLLRLDEDKGWLLG
jgi:hypothetical protein